MLSESTQNLVDQTQVITHRGQELPLCCGRNASFFVILEQKWNNQSHGKHINEDKNRQGDCRVVQDAAIVRPLRL